MSAAQENTVTDANAQFENWYVQNAFDYAANPIGSRDCGLMRRAWHAALAARQPMCGTCAEVIQPDALTGTTCGCARKPQAGKYDQSAEDQFERFLQAEIARSPDALRELGGYLGRVLDEDEFPQANRLLLQLATEYAAPPAQGIDLGPSVIPDTPEVRHILGRPNFWCSPWANVLRIRGDVIPRKAEEEQAAVIRFMLNHYLARGVAWAETAEAELDAIRKADSQRDAAPGVGNG